MLMLFARTWMVPLSVLVIADTQETGQHVPTTTNVPLALTTVTPILLALTPQAHLLVLAILGTAGMVQHAQTMMSVLTVLIHVTQTPHVPTLMVDTHVLVT